MDEKRITLTKQQLDAMDATALNALLVKATKMQATAVVRRADGSIKYDDPALAGTYHEEQLT